MAYYRKTVSYRGKNVPTFLSIEYNVANRQTLITEKLCLNTVIYVLEMPDNSNTETEWEEMATANDWVDCPKGEFDNDDGKRVVYKSSENPYFWCNNQR